VEVIALRKAETSKKNSAPIASSSKVSVNMFPANLPARNTLRDTGFDTIKKTVRRSISRLNSPLERKMARRTNMMLITPRPTSVSTRLKVWTVTSVTSVVHIKSASAKNPTTRVTRLRRASRKPFNASAPKPWIM